MYRQYENPHTLEQQLEELKEELHRAYSLGADAYEIAEIKMEITELKNRINFA